MDRPRGHSRRPGAVRSLRSAGHCRRTWSLSSATKSTSQKMSFRPHCATESFGWQPFRTRNSTNPRRCACLPTTSPASSVALNRVLLATGRYIGEGFDDARLDTLFLTMPVSWRGTVAQYVGRLHRLHDRKREVRVYDYA